MYQDYQADTTAGQVLPPKAVSNNIDHDEPIKVGIPPYQPTVRPTRPAYFGGPPGMNILTLSVIGMNLLMVTPLAWSVWSYSQFVPRERLPNVE